MTIRMWTALSVGFMVGMPFCLCVMSSFVSTISSAGSTLLLLAILSLFVLFFVTLICVGIGFVQAWKRRWGSVLQCAIAPAIIATFVAFPSDTIGTFFGTADYVHFAAFSWRYEAAVNAASRINGPRFLWFFWTDASAPLSKKTLIFLVFDESDEFARPDAQRSAAWEARAQDSFANAAKFVRGTEMPDKVHHLFGHYYVAHVQS